MNDTKRLTRMYEAIIGKGYNVLENKLDNFRMYSTSYDATYTTEGLNPVNIEVQLSIYMSKDYIDEYDSEKIFEVNRFPMISKGLKLVLGMYGIFAFIKINADRRLTEKEVLQLEAVDIKSQILDTVRKVSRRDIPIVTSITQNQGTSLFFIKRVFNNPATSDEETFIINDHGESTIEILNHLTMAASYFDMAAVRLEEEYNSSSIINNEKDLVHDF